MEGLGERLKEAVIAALAYVFLPPVGLITYPLLVLGVLSLMLNNGSSSLPSTTASLSERLLRAGLDDSPSFGAPPTTESLADRLLRAGLDDPPVFVAPPGENECSPEYSGCVPADRGDVDCGDLDETDIEVIGDDVYRLDADNDGWACEPWPPDEEGTTDDDAARSDESGDDCYIVAHVDLGSC